MDYETQHFGSLLVGIINGLQDNILQWIMRRNILQVAILVESPLHNIGFPVRTQVAYF